MVFQSFFRFRGYFCNFYVSEVFQSFFRFREYFGLFLGFKGILVILWVYGGILVIFNVMEVFQSFFRFRGYFGHFKVLGRIYVVFRFRMYFGGFMGTLVFLVVLGCFRVG